MEQTTINFKNFLNYLGILDEKDCKYLFVNSLMSNNENLIYLLGKILKMKYKKENIKKIIRLSNNILIHYVFYDNKKLILTFRKLLFIYSQFKKEKKRNYLYKWIMNITKDKNNKKKNIKNPFQLEKSIKKNNNYKRANSAINIKLSITKTNQLTFLNNKETVNKNLSMIKLKNNESNNLKENSSFLNSKSKKHSKTARQLIYNKLINNISSDLKKQKNNNIKKIKDKKKFFTELSKSNIERDKKIYEMRIKLNKKFDNIYTFTPIIYTKDYNNKFRSSSQPFYERLEDDKRKRKKNLDKLEKEIVDKEKPRNYNNKKNKSYSADFDNKYDIYLKRKKEKIRQIQENIDKEKGITFKPNLNKKYNDKVIKEPFKIRNNIYIENKDNELNKIISLNNIDKECTFIPKINDNYSFKENFSERQNYYSRRKNKNLEEIKIKNTKVYPFKPKISQNSKDIIIKKKNIIKIIKNKNDEFAKKLTFGLNSSNTRSINVINDDKKEENKGRNYIFESHYSLEEFNEILFRRFKKEKDDFIKENFNDKKNIKLSTTDKSISLSQLRLNDDEQSENDFQMRMKKIVNENYEREKIRQQRCFYHKNKQNNNIYPDLKYYEIIDEF